MNIRILARKATLVALVALAALTVAPPAASVAAANTATISGYIRWTLDSLPATEGFVNLYDSRDPIQTRKYVQQYVLSDHTGTYKFENVPPGTYEVYVQLSGLLRGGQRSWSDGSQSPGVLTVRAGEVKTGIDVTFEGAASVSGRVTDDQGIPQAYTRVEAEIASSPYANHGRIGRALTDAQGNYVMAVAVDPDWYVYEYFVRAFGETGRQALYWPGFIDPREDERSVIPLAVGERRTGINFALPELPPIFEDVPRSSPFYTEIEWMWDRGISTGYQTATGYEYRPYGNVTRDAMAAFLYRYAGYPTFTAPATSPFVDVSTTNPFYTEITWLADQKVTTGWQTADDKREYRPYDAITRDAMAAFLYRFSGTTYQPTGPSPFIDVTPSSAFYKEISWMNSEGISTGWSTPAGREYRPFLSITRDAMAAFLYRYDQKNATTVH